MLDRVRRGGVGADGDYRERAMVRRKTHTVYQQLPFVERAEIGRGCIA
jgi:hypothetical protein